MKIRIIIFGLPIIIMLAFSCEFLNVKKQGTTEKTAVDPSTRPVARSHNSYLYYKDLEGLVPPNTSIADSTNLILRYVQSWINKQLVISEATNKLDIDEADLERKVLDYRYALLIHEYQKLYITQNLNNEVGENEIESYYNSNKDNFRLRQTIVKCRFIKVPVNAPRIQQLRKLYISDQPKDFDELKRYCNQYAVTYFLDSTWINFDELINNTPLVTIDNKIHFLMNNRVYETNDQSFTYFLRILEYKISDQIAPLEWVKDDIVKMIINKRKITLSEELEDAIYQRAVNNNDFEIYETN